ncbi:unnamed protein product [Bursaphelenchus xylophilus]|uniref:(pine wood nematode) hypothetical protein n=1 Tax=Bursaphelenchus xylophilus TaxID=6326 RepID=A0A7I8WK96_BURXY|nr:unnamed protein product [Bursaphelenchus xylophilus]CAG9106936.1 unnamed protein product [Bursaphelenchus xylophilus]
MERPRDLNSVVQLLLCQQIALDGTSEEDLGKLQRSFSSLPKHTPRYEPFQILTEKKKSPQRSPKIDVQRKEQTPKPLKVHLENSNGIANASNKASTAYNNLTVAELEKPSWTHNKVSTYSPIQVVIDPAPLSLSEAVSAQPSSSQTDVNGSSYQADLPDMNEQAVIARICALRAQGKWSLTRLPLCVEAPRPKVHHDFFLEEVQLMAVDFRQERHLKKYIAKMLAYEAAQVVRGEEARLFQTSSSKRFRSLKPNEFEMATFSGRYTLDDEKMKIVECPLHGRQRVSCENVVKSERFLSKLSSENPVDRVSAINTVRSLCLFAELPSPQETDEIDEEFRLRLRPEERYSSWDRWNHLVINRRKVRRRSRSLDLDDVHSIERLNHRCSSSFIIRVFDHYESLSKSSLQSLARTLSKLEGGLPFIDILPALNRLYSFYQTVRSLNVELTLRAFKFHLKRLTLELEKYSRKVVLSSLTRLKSRRFRKYLDVSSKFRELLIHLVSSEQRFLLLTATEKSANVISEGLTAFNVENIVCSGKDAIEEFNSSSKKVFVVNTRNSSSLEDHRLFDVYNFVVIETDLTSRQAKLIEKFQNGLGGDIGRTIVLTAAETLEDFFYSDTAKPRPISEVLEEAAKRYLKGSDVKPLAIASEFDCEVTIYDEKSMETELKVPLSVDVNEWDSGEAFSPLSSTSTTSNSDSGISLSYPLFYDATADDNEVIAALLDNNWNEQISSFGRLEEQQFMDSLTNPWYHGEVVEPDPFAFTDDLSPMEFMDDTQNVHNNAPDSAGGYIFPYSPKSSEDLPDDETGTIASTMDQVEASLDGFIVERTPPPQNHRSEVVEPPVKKGTGQKKKIEESQRNLYGNQVIMLPDPNPIVKPDGKPGFTPPVYPAEWVDADVPAWNVIEDVCLLRAVVSQLKAVPLPAYVSRSFCVNWELVTRAVKRVSFHQRTPFRCCMRFRELIGAQKKLAPTDNADLQGVSFDGLDLPEVFDERVKASTMPITRCFMRTITILMRKHAELRKTRLIWQKRMDLLHEADETPRYSVMRKMLERSPRAVPEMNAESRSYIESRGVTHILPSYSILKAIRNGNPTEPNVVYQHYTKKMRILRVLNTAHSFINRHFKEPSVYMPIQPFYGSTTNQDGLIFAMKRVGWVAVQYNKASLQKKSLPKIENILERRCLFLNDPKDKDTPKYSQEEITRIRAQSQHPIDVRATNYPSQQSMADALKLASSYYRPARRSDVTMGRVDIRDHEINKDMVKVVLDDETKQDTLNSIKERRKNGKKPYVILSNGIPVLPVVDGKGRQFLAIRDDPVVYPYSVSVKAAELVEKHGINLSGINGFEVFLERLNEEIARIENEKENLIWPEAKKRREEKMIGKILDESNGTLLLKVSYVPSQLARLPTNYVIRLLSNGIVELHQLPNISTLPRHLRIPLEWKAQALQKSFNGQGNSMETGGYQVQIPESSFIRKSMYQVQQDYVNVSEDEKAASRSSYDRIAQILKKQKFFVKFTQEQFDHCVKLENVKPAIVKKRNLLGLIDWQQKLDRSIEKKQRFRLIRTSDDKNEFWLHDRDGDLEESKEFKEIKVGVDPEAIKTKGKGRRLVLRPENPSGKLKSQFEQIIEENIRSVLASLDKCRQKDGGHSSKDLENHDDLRAVVLAEFDAVVANISAFEMDNVKIKATFDDEDEEPALVLTCVPNKNVVNLQSEVESGQVKLGIAVQADPYEDLNEHPAESSFNKLESDTSLLPVLARPHIKDTIIKRLGKWSTKRRSRWINVLKYRFLRRKTVRLNKAVKSSVKLITDADPSTSKNPSSERNEGADGDKRPLTSTEYKKLAIRKSLATMRKKKEGESGNDALNKSPVKLANELASSTPDSGVSTPKRSRLPTHQEDTEHPTTPAEKSPQPKVFNTVSELVLATKLKTLDQSHDLLSPEFVEAKDLPDELAKELKEHHELCAFKFNRQSDDVFVTNSGIREVFGPPSLSTKNAKKKEELKDPLHILGLATMGPSEILKMRTVKIPPRIQKKHQKIKEKLEKEAIEFKTEEVEEKVEEQLPQEEPKPSAEQFQRDYYGTQKKIYTPYGHASEQTGAQRVVMVRPGTSIPVHSRQIHTATGGGQIRTYAVHSQIHPPPQQHFTSAGQPVSIHQPIPGSSSHNQQASAIRKDRVPTKQNPSKPRPGERQGVPIGRRIGRNDSISNDPNRELTVREKLQRDLQLGVNQQGPASQNARRPAYPKHQLQRVSQPIQRTSHPALKRRLEDPGSLQVELQPMETDKRRKMSPSYQGQGYQPVQRISPSTPTDPTQAQIVISQPQTSSSGQSYRQGTQSQYVVQNPHSSEYAPLEIRLHLQDSQGKPIQCPSSVPTVANVRLSPTGENKEKGGPVIEHESSVVPVHTPRGMEYRVQIPRLPDEARQYQIKLSLPGQTTAQVYGVPEETPVKDVLEMRQPQSQPRGNRQEQKVQIIQPQGPGGPQYVQFQYNTAQDQAASSGSSSEGPTSSDTTQLKKQEMRTVQPIRAHPPQRKIVEYQIPGKVKDSDRRPQTIDPKQRIQTGPGARLGQTRYFSVQQGQSASSSPSTSQSDHPIPSTISTTQRNPSPVTNPIQQNRQRRVTQGPQRTAPIHSGRRGSAQIIHKKSTENPPTP